MIRGRVQGVGFRYYVVRNARELGIRGTVRNRSDGAVEVLLQTERPEAIEELLGRLHRGPRASRVDDVEVAAVEGDVERYEGFEVVW